MVTMMKTPPRQEGEPVPHPTEITPQLKTEQIQEAARERVKT